MASDPFIDTLVTTCEANPDVLGLVLCGSSAETERRDQWSDHDFLLITTDGTPERYRTELSWLPDAADIAFWFRETAHGLKVLYRSGLIIEFAVFDTAEFAACALNHYAVVIDRGGIADIATEVRTRSMAPRTVDALAELRLFLSLVYIGTGRARRGERLSANVMIRTYALEHLLRSVRVFLPNDATTQLDMLDVWRRFESADPDLAARIDTALSCSIDECGRHLLAIADDWFAARWSDYPAGDTQTVRSLLGW